MRAEQCRTEGNHIKVRILAQDDRALQTSVNSLNYAVLAVLLLVNLQYVLQDVTLRVRVPAAVHR